MLVRMSDNETPELSAIIYTNGLTLHMSPYDVQFELSHGSPLGVSSRALVVMSPQHARILNGLLSAALAEYERKFGPIPSDAGTPNATEFTSRDTHN